MIIVLSMYDMLIDLDKWFTMKAYACMCAWYDNTESKFLSHAMWSID